MINVLLCNLLMVIGLRLFSCGLMSRKYHHYFHEVVLYAILCVSSYCGFIWLRVLVVIGVCSWYVCSKYVAIRSFQILVLCVYFVCLRMSEWVCASVFHKVEGLSAYDYGTGMYALLLCFTFMMLFVLLYVAYQMLYAYKMKFWMKYVWMLCILPVSSLLLFLNIEDVFVLFVFDELVVVALLGVFLSNLIVLFMYRQVVELCVVKEKYMELENKYFSLHELYASSCVLLHEVSRKVFLLKNESDDALRLGVQDLSGVLFHQFHNTHTNCASLRKVLVKYQKELGEWQIDVHSDMRIWHSSFCEELFECLMEYGISLCQRVSGLRSMIFESYEYHHMVVLKYVVSCNEKDMVDVKIPFGEMHSIKIVDGFCEITLVFDRGCV